MNKLIEAMIAFKLAITSGDDVLQKKLLKDLDNRVQSLQSHIKAVYEPTKGDLVFLKSNDIGLMVTSTDCVAYNKQRKLYYDIPSIPFNKVRIFGRVTNGENDTILSQHYNHFRRFTHVRNTIKDASKYYNVPTFIIETLLYNESKFNNKSKSHTGVTGISMLTESTAKQYDIDKSSVVSQIYGTSKILRHHFDNLPKYYSDEDRWRLSAIIYNRGKSYYFKTKKLLHNKGIPLTYDNMMKGFKHYSYMKEGIEYGKRLDKYKYMFKGK